MGFLDIGNLLKQYLGATPAQSSPEVDQHFQQAAQVAPHEALSHGLAEAFRSDQTPPFGQMLAQLFAQSSPQQQAAILTQLFSTLGPGVLSSLAAAGGAGNLAALSAGGQSQVTLQQAAQVSPQAVQQLASQAEQTNPSIIDLMSSFYAQHPGLVKTLGGGALTLIMAKMAERLNVVPSGGFKMGLFDFVRNIGNKIFHRDDEAAQKIREHIEENNPGINNLGVEYDPATGKASLSGDATDPEALQKAVLMAGNVQGVAEVNVDKVKVKGTVEDIKVDYYIIKSGDTLSKIAKQYYGDANQYPRIFEANREVIKHPDKIFPGQKIRIPPG